MTVRRALRVVQVVTWALLAPMSIAGCGPPAAADPLAWTAYVVAPTANELAPELSAEELARVRAVAGHPDNAGTEALVVVGGDPNITSVDITPRRPNGQVEHGPRARILVERVVEALTAAVARAGALGRDPDLLRALADAARTGARRIVVLSAGVTTSDPLDLRVSGFDRDPSEMARELRQIAALPDLTGKTVEFSGLGRVVDPQHPLNEPEQGFLRRLWLAVCAEAGGRCELDDSMRPARAPLSSLASPTVPIPALHTIIGPTGDGVIEVPTFLLFQPGSCALIDRDSASAALELVAARVRAGHAAVSISGRTAPVGPGHGIELSQCRARAAADLLIAAGAPATAIVDVRGDGDLLDPPSASHGSDGRLDPDKLPALRRVVFTLSPVGGLR